MIYLVYAEEQSHDAEGILRFLTERKHLAVSSQRKNCTVLQSDKRVPQDSAVILISSSAIESGEWQALVAGIPEEIHIIPVCSTRDADYVDPEKIPAKIKEINYIYLDGMHLENIWDSLTTKKEFYRLKSMLLLNRNVWIFSQYSEAFLLTDRKAVRQYLSIFQAELQREDNPYFREELTGIVDYLNHSMGYAQRLLRAKIKRGVTLAVAAAAVVISLVLMTKLSGLSTRLVYTNSVISTGSYGEIAPVNSIKLVDGITNPFISDERRKELYNTLSEHLDENWQNTPVGGNYTWALNDAQIAADERYIWSANGDGAVAKWDTYTGKIVERADVSSQPLLTLGVSAHERLFAAVDFDGYVFKKSDGGPWERSAESYDIPNYSGTAMACSGETGWAVLSGALGNLMWFDLQSGVRLIWEDQVDKIFCTELSGGGLEAVVRKDDALYDLCVRADGTVDELRIPIDNASSCTMDILNGVVVMADSNFQIVTWSRADPELVRPAGIVLSRPLCLCFVNDNVIAYNDRNTGTHLYDLSGRLDLGSILEHAAVVSSLSASQNTVMAHSITYNTENIADLLPAGRPDWNGVSAVYSEQTAASEGRIQRAAIENEYIIRVALHLEDRDMTLVIDGGNRFYIGKAQCDSSLVQEDGTEVFYYVDKPVNLVGRPTVIGITHNGDALLAGGSDGSFFELIFTETGGWLRGAQRQIPSHSAVAAIYQTPDCYYLEDAAGTFWRARTGCDSLTPEGAAAAVRERLHYAATEDIYETVSKETLEALNVAIIPGGGKREWE